MSFRCALLRDTLRKEPGYPQSPAVRFCSAVAIHGRIFQDAANRVSFRAFKIDGDRIAHLIPAQVLFLAAMQLQSREGIRHRCDARAVYRNVIILQASMGRVAALFNGAMGNQVQQQLRRVAVLIFQVEVNARFDAGDRLQQVFAEHVIELCQIVSLILLKRHLKDLCHVDLDQIVHGIFQPRQGHPVAPQRDPPSGKLGRVSVFHKAGNQRLVAGETGIGKPILKQDLQSAAEQPLIHIVEYAYGDIGSGFQLVRRLQYQVGQMVRVVASVRGGAADLIVMGVAQQEAGEDKGGLVVRHALRDALFIVRKQSAVQLAAGTGPAVGPLCHIVPADPLTCLSQIPGGAFQDLAVGFQHFPKVFLHRRVGFLPLHLRDGFDGALDPVDNAQQNIFFRGIQLLRLFIRILPAVPLHLVEKSIPAKIQADLIVSPKMVHLSDTGNQRILVLNRLEPAVIKNGRHFHVIGGSHAFKGTHTLQNEHPSAR